MSRYEDQWVRDIVDEIERIEWYELDYSFERKYRLIPHYRDHTYDSYFRALALFVDEIKEML